MGAEAPADPPAAEPKRFKDYELLEEIARGGMGVVYRARQISLNRIVAVKMILRGEWAGERELVRFRLEAEAAACLKHPNIVPIHEVGESDGQHFFSMDYVAGSSLSTLLRDGPLPAFKAGNYVEKIARAIHYAHERGVLHRDLKPSNVLLDAQDEPHVTDFGLAKRLDSAGQEAENPELTLSGQVLGTPSFMPPEQACGARERMGPGSDVYSLGAILYSLLTGRPPFVGADSHAILTQVVHSEVLTPRLLNPAIPRDLEVIALKCLEKDPLRRYGSARALADDLARYLNHEPIHATPPSTIYRARKFVRRHRVGVGVAAGFASVLAVATVVSVTFGLRANREKSAALTAKAGIEKAEARTRRKADEAYAVLGFLRNHVLAAARPEGADGGLGYDVTLRQAVVAAESRIAIDFTNQPQVELEIRHALGTTFMHLADYSNAIGQFRRTKDLAAALGGQTHFTTLEEMCNLGHACLESGQVTEAAELFEEVLRVRLATVPADQNKIMETKASLAEVYCETDQYAKAIPMLVEVVAWRKKHLGEKARPTLVAMNNLGLTYDTIDRTREGLPLLKEVYEWRLSNLGPEDLDTLVSMQNLAGAHRKLHELPEAFELLQKALAASRKKLGPDHASSIKILNSLGLTHMSDGNFGQAVPWLEEAVQRQTKRYGDDHFDSLTILNNLGAAYRNSGRPAEAIPLFERAVKVARKRKGAADPDTVGAMQDLAIVNLEANRAAGAEKICRELREILQPDSRGLAETLSDLGESLLRQEKFADAESVLIESVGIFEKKQPNLSPLFTAQSRLGWALLGQGKNAPAKDLLLNAHKGLARRQIERPSSARASLLTDIANRLVQLYEAEKDPDEAAKWRQKSQSP